MRKLCLLQELTEIFTAAIKQAEENLQQFLRGKLITICGLKWHSHSLVR